LNNHEKDYEMFLQDLEEDAEFRSHIKIYSATEDFKDKDLEDKMKSMDIETVDTRAVKLNNKK